MEARCQECGKSISVFDSDFDGYEQCRKRRYTHVTTKGVNCIKCFSNDFSVGIRYEYPDIQELQALEISQADNAFTWIWLTLKCNKCGAKYKNSIDFDTT